MLLKPRNKLKLCFIPKHGIHSLARSRYYINMHWKPKLCGQHYILDIVLSILSILILTVYTFPERLDICPRSYSSNGISD